LPLNVNCRKESPYASHTPGLRRRGTMKRFLQRIGWRFYRTIANTAGFIGFFAVILGPIVWSFSGHTLTVVVLQNNREHSASGAPPMEGESKPLIPGSTPAANDSNRMITSFLFKLDSDPASEDLTVWEEEGSPARKGVVFRFHIKDLKCARKDANIDFNADSALVREITSPESTAHEAEFDIMLLYKDSWVELDVLHGGPGTPVLGGREDAAAVGRRTGVSLWKCAKLMDYHDVRVEGPPTRNDLVKVALYFLPPVFVIAGLITVIVIMSICTPPGEGPPAQLSTPLARSEMDESNPTQKVPPATGQDEHNIRKGTESPEPHGPNAAAPRREPEDA